jgi:ribose 5-phosphate isomerase A
VSEDKLVDSLGEKFAVPVEVIPEAVGIVESELKTLGATKIDIRQAEKKYGPVISEHGNIVIDASFSSISPELEHQINAITGVVENGLFVDFIPEIILARGKEVYSRQLLNGKLEEVKLSL